MVKMFYRLYSVGSSYSTRADPWRLPTGSDAPTWVARSWGYLKEPVWRGRVTAATHNSERSFPHFNNLIRLYLWVPAEYRAEEYATWIRCLGRRQLSWDLQMELESRIGVSTEGCWRVFQRKQEALGDAGNQRWEGAWRTYGNTCFSLSGTWSVKGE